MDTLKCATFNSNNIYYSYFGKCSESVQSRAKMYMLKACDACADMGQL